ncbi:MFS transporter [Actinomadura sp. NPDC047616]|uniref:MFS transporter n=1 Tax=Actinomadura sp. NPDC047616 TaxID=3155914 RepID=UPI0033CA4249
MLAASSPTLLLKDVSVARLFVARVAGNAGDGFGQIALSFGALHLGYGATGLSAVVACKTAPTLLVVAGGLAGDRCRRHRVMASAEILAAGAWTGLAACFLLGAAPLAVVCGLAALSGLARSLLLPAERGIVADLVHGEDRRAANALLGQSVAAGLLTGLVLSGAVVAAAGPGWAAAIKAGTSALGAVLLRRLRTPQWRRDRRPGVMTDLGAGWREFTSTQWVWVLTAQFTAVAVAVTAFSAVLGPLYMAQGHGGPGGWGMVAGLEAAGALAGGVVAARWRPARPVLAMALLPATAATPLLLTGAGATWWTLALVSPVPGACQTIYGVLWTTTVQATFPPQVLARVNSWNLLGGFAFTPAAVLVAGPLSSGLGVTTTTLGAAALVIAATLATLTSTQVRHLHTEPPDSTTSAATPAAP